MKTNTTHNMFISEQYGWLVNISGGYFDAMMDYGWDSYWLIADKPAKAFRDVDLMLMGL